MLPSPQILLVDDNEMDLELSEYALKKINRKVEILSFSNGRKVMDFLNVKAKLNLNSIGLMILDLNMPLMDGFDVLEDLYRLKINSFPVIILSSSNLNEDQSRARQLGATSFHQKPFGYIETIEFFSEILKEYLPNIINSPIKFPTS